MSELNFIEYNVNTEEYSPADVVIALRGLGFQQISDAKNYKATMWACNGCIILLSLHNNIPTGLSGFGLNMPTAPDGSRHCETTGLNIWKDPNGLNVYSYPVENFRQAFDDHFTMDSGHNRHTTKESAYDSKRTLAMLSKALIIYRSFQP